MNKEYYYCYSPNLFKLIQSKKISYICTGRNRKNGKNFWLYEMSAELSQALREYTAESVKYRKPKKV